MSELRDQSRELVLQRLEEEKLATVTLDWALVVMSPLRARYDGSVISTTRKAEGITAGYNEKKGLHSYYPLFCAVAQSGQILDLHHRSGNVYGQSFRRLVSKRVWTELSSA